MKGAREKLLYVPAIVIDKSRPDYLATVDADPTSETYSQVWQSFMGSPYSAPHIP